MEITPQIFTAKVMHKRLFPKVNAFVYKIYYTALPLNNLLKKPIIDGLALNRFSPLSFYCRDHASREENVDLEQWARDILQDYGLNEIVDDIVLVSMPRVFGYVFNPVSFWLCFDKDRHLRAVINEVNNTFGQTHTYLCAHNDHRPLQPKDWMSAKKLFHVSPFLEREGHYKFRFDVQDHKLGVWIDFYDAQGRKKLLTSLVGQLTPMNKKSLRRVFWSHPLVTFKSIFLIHLQAVKLIFKGIRHLRKPDQIKPNISASDNLTKL